MLRRSALAGLALLGSPLAAGSLHAQSPAASGVPATAAAAVARQPLPTVRGPLALGKDAFAILRACQEAGWLFHPRAGEEEKRRRGVRYVLTAANVLPPESDPASRYRLTFLDGRLVGLRTEWRAADPQRLDAARVAHGAPAWEAAASAEWVAPDKSVAYAVWRDGTREELVFLAHTRSRGFFTEAEIAQELKRRKEAAGPLSAPKPSPATPGLATGSASGPSPAK